MQGRQGIMIADDGILVVLQAGLLWSAGGEEKEARRGEKGKPFCCAERQYEGLSVMKDSLFTGAVCIAERRGVRPGRDVIAERRKHVSIPGKSCRVVGFFEDASANQLQKEAVTVG